MQDPRQPGCASVMWPVAIRGEGVAAACCAHLLRDAVSVNPQPHTRVPAIVVSLATQTLMGDVFQSTSLFRGLPSIDHRIVAWGPGRAPVALPHQAAVISEEALMARLHVESAAELADDSAWTIFASRPLPEPAVERHFGTRRAAAVAVELNEPEVSACWVESLESGWLFLIPGCLIAVGGAPEALLSQSRLVAPRIRAVSGAAAEFPAYPRIADPLCMPGWLACGSAAMAFDPICGDGTGNAVREAILAAAVLRAIARGENADALLAHYRARLIAGFRRHLELALEFYRAGDSGPWWQEEIRALERGIAWCAAELAALPAFRYRLEGFDLIAVSAG